MKNSSKNMKINIPINFSNASIKYNDTQKNKKFIDSYMNINSNKKNDNKQYKFNTESLENYDLYPNTKKNEMKNNKIKGIKINNFKNALQMTNNNNSIFNEPNKLNFQSKSDRIMKSSAKKNELFLLK